METKEQIEKVKTKYLDYLTKVVEEQEKKKIQLDENLENYDFVLGLITIINNQRDLFIEELETNTEEKQLFYNIMSRIVSNEDVKNFLNSSHNLYNLRKIGNKEIVEPQIEEAKAVINNFINYLNRFICRTNREVYIKDINNITDYIERIMDLANAFEYNTSIDDFDIYENLLEKSDLTEDEKDRLIEYTYNHNLDYYKAEKKDTIEELSQLDEKMLMLEDIITTDEFIKLIINLIERVPISKINLDDYKIDSEYTPDIEEYLLYVRNTIREYFIENEDLTIDDALKKFSDSYKTKEKLENRNLIFLMNNNNKSYIEQDLSKLNSTDKDNLSILLNKVALSEDKVKKGSTDFPKLSVYDIKTSSYKGVYISYALVDNAAIILGTSDKKIKEHNELIENRVSENEENIIDLMTKVIKKEDITDLYKSSENIKNRIYNKIDIDEIEELTLDEPESIRK